MRPISLRIEGLRSFKTEPPTVIDFGDRDQIAIIGDTGAGKSSILEAMTYALYGQVSFSAHANQELMNDDCQYLRVVFSFWAASYQWHATRTLQRKKSGEAGSGTARLEKSGDNDETLQIVEGVKEVNKHVTSLLGLDVNAFLRTIVLPQGRFARLLTEDEPRNRANILRQIWQTGDIEQAAQEVKTAIKELELLTTRIDGASAQHPEDPPAHLAGLRKTEAEASRRLEKARRAESEAVRMLETLTTELERHTLGKTAIETAQSAHLEGFQARTIEIAGQSRTLNDRLKSVKDERAEIQNRIDHTEKVDQKHVDRADQLVTALNDLNGKSADQTTVQAELETAKANLEKAGNARRRAEQASEKARSELDGLEQTTTDHERAAQAALQASNQAQNAWDQYRDTLLEPLERIEAERETLLEEHRNLKKRLNEQDADVAKARDRLHATETALQTAVRQDRAAAASAHARPGEPCPVCARALPGTWSRPDGGDITAVQHDQETARSKLQQAEQTAAGTQVQLTVNTESGKKNRSELDRIRSRSQQTEPDLRKLLNLQDLTAEQAVEEALDSLRKAEVAALHTATKAKRAIQPHRDTMVAAAGHLAAAANDQRHAAALTTSGEERLTKATRETRRAAEAVLNAGGAEPLTDEQLKDWDNHHENRTASLQKAIEQASGRAAELREMAAQHIRWTAALLTHGVNAQTIDQQIRREVTEPTDRITQEIADKRSEIQRVLSQLGTPVTDDGAPTEERQTIEIDLERLTNVVKRLEQEGRTAQTEARSKGQQIRQTLTELLESEGIQVNPKDAEEIRQQLRKRTEEAAGAQSFTARQIAAFQETEPILNELRRTAENARNRQNRLQEIDTALKAGAFPKWLTLRRSTDLLRHASKNLEDMTHHRYAFRDPRDTEEQWKILDRQTGATRSPASLSGGEQFIASLSLALGMVETMGQRGGRLESFFLDEGFGSLDESALETALDALDQASTPEHLVGVITHVRRIAERVPHVLSVERNPSTGSSARWLEQADEATGQSTNDRPAEPALRNTQLRPPSASEPAVRD